MRVAIVNFSRQSLVSPHEIRAAVQRLPREHYAKIKIIRYDPERSLALEMAYINNNPESLRARGTYLHDGKGMGSDPRKIPISLYLLFKAICFSTLELKKSGNSSKMDLTYYNIYMFTASQSLQISAMAESLAGIVKHRRHGDPAL